MEHQEEFEKKLRDIAERFAEDSEFAMAFREMSFQDKARELVKNQGFSHADIGYMLTELDLTKEISLVAGTFWAP
jgi:hypothetical protein